MSNLIRKHRYLATHAASSMLRRKGKYGVLLFAYTWCVFVLATTVFFGGALREEARNISRTAPDITVQKVIGGRQVSVDADTIEALGGIRGVRSAHGRRWGYYFDTGATANYTVIEDGSVADGTVVLGEGVARMRGAVEKDVVVFTDHHGEPRRLTVFETMPMPTALAASDVILLAPSDFMAITGMDDAGFTDAALTVGNPAEIPTIMQKIADMPGLRPISSSQVQSTYEALFTWKSSIVIIIFGAVVMAFVIIAWDRATGLSFEERAEIGVLAGIGWDTGDILSTKFWEGAIISLTAFLAGCILAYAHVFLFGAPLVGAFMKGWSTLMPPFRLAPVIDPVEVAALFFFTVMPFTLATVFPAWRAASGDPDEIMR